jgi:hypothetical protein
VGEVAPGGQFVKDARGEALRRGRPELRGEAGPGVEAGGDLLMRLADVPLAVH